MLKIILQITGKEVLLNDFSGKEASFLCNFFTIAKQYIYLCKCQNMDINFANFLLRVHHVYVDEKHNAKLLKTMSSFYQKWNIYHSVNA